MFVSFLRVSQLLYSRLLLCKERSASLAQQDVFEVNPVALELGLVESSGPGAAIAAQVQQIRQQRQQQEGGIEERPEWLYYTYMLEAWEKVFDSEMDQGTFEENMRFLFGTKVSVGWLVGLCALILAVGEGGEQKITDMCSLFRLIMCSLWTN